MFDLSGGQIAALVFVALVFLGALFIRKFRKKWF
jgi:hypothetical protein